MPVRQSLVVVCAVAVFVLSACAKGPESTVENFYSAVGKGEITEAQGYLSSQVRGMLPAQKLASVLTEEHKRVVGCGGIKSIDVSLQGEGEVRFGTVTVRYRGDCPAKREEVELVREQDQWKIGMNK